MALEADVWIGRANELALQLLSDGAAQDLVQAPPAGLGLTRAVLKLGGEAGLSIDSQTEPARFDIGVTEATTLTITPGLAAGIEQWEGKQAAVLVVYSAAWPQGLVWARDLRLTVRQD